MTLILLVVVIIVTLIGVVLHAGVYASAEPGVPRWSITFWLFVIGLACSLLLLVNRFQPFLGK